MTELAALVSRYGLPSVLLVVLLYMLLRGEVQFRYPRSNKKH